MEIRITSSAILKDQKRSKDQRSQLLLAIRIYRNNILIDRFNFSLKDINKPIYLLRSELKKGIVVNHENSIRYNSLIEFAKKTFYEVAEKELSVKNTLNRVLLKEIVGNIINADFNIEFVDQLNKEIISIKGSGFNEFDEISVDKRAMDVFNKMEINNEPTVDEFGNVDTNDFDAGDYENMILSENEELDNQVREIKISRLSTEVRYKRNLYNKKNIFELFASIRYNVDIPSTYNKIIIRLFEYRHFVKPKEETSYFNEKWIKNFFSFLWNEGYTNLSTKIFDPLKFNPIIFQGKRKLKYDVDNFYKLFEVLKTVSNKFIVAGLLSNIDFSKIDLYEICKKRKSKKGKRINNNLSNNEFNKLFFYKFDVNKLKLYQSIFSEKFDKSKIKISIDHINNARDLFCIQVMAGGLRGYRDLVTTNFNKDDNTLSFKVKKTKDWMINPLNIYTEIISRDYNYNLPKLDFNNSINTKQEIYRALLKTIADIVSFDRKIIYKNKEVKIKEIFNPYFARKSFSQIMFDEYDFTLEEISMFTGHLFEKNGKSILTHNYIETDSPIKKKRLFSRIKLPDGFTINTPRK